VTGGIALAMVGLAEGVSAARLLAARGGYTVDTDQELIATGAANMGSGIFGGMGVAGSLSKTAAAERAGSKSQITGVAAAAIVILALIALAGALSPLPRCVLSAIVIQAVWGLMDVGAIRHYRDIRRNDFTSSLAALLGVLLFGPLYGLLVAIGTPNARRTTAFWSFAWTRPCSGPTPPRSPTGCWPRPLKHLIWKRCCLTWKRPANWTPPVSTPSS
jgi:sulfate permease, SulP family